MTKDTIKQEMENNKKLSYQNSLGIKYYDTNIIPEVYTIKRMGSDTLISMSRKIILFIYNPYVLQLSIVILLIIIYTNIRDNNIVLLETISDNPPPPLPWDAIIIFFFLFLVLAFTEGAQ